MTDLVHLTSIHDVFSFPTFLWNDNNNFVCLDSSSSLSESGQRFGETRNQNSRHFTLIVEGPALL